MLFSDKLNFLLKLTDTSNKQLAAALLVDPSLISRMRKGKRKPPHNTQHIQNMALFFAKKCTTDYQRSALAETIGQSRIKLIMKNEALAALIAQWIGNAEATPGNQIRQLIQNWDIADMEEAENIASPLKTPPISKSDSAISYTYYGNSGKRSAVRTLVRYLIDINKPCCLYISCDESLEWVNESPSFAKELTSSMYKLFDAGYTFLRIAPRIGDTEDAVDFFSRWLPVYIYGNMQTFYYPRMRDNVFHRTLFVAPGIAAVCSSSVGYHIDSDLTFFHLDPKIADAVAQEFQDYLAKCVPMTTTHNHGQADETILDCLLRYVKTQGNFLSKYLGLPTPLVPSAVFHNALSDNPEAEAVFTEITTQYLQGMKQYKKTEIISLADAKDVLAGKVLCLVSKLVPDATPYYYSPNEYIQHLRAILEFMEAHQDYTAVVSANADATDSLIVVEGSLCCVFRIKEPLTLFEISEQNVVAAACEYISYLADSSYGMRNKRRRETMELITDLICEIERKLPQ